MFSGSVVSSQRNAPRRPLTVRTSGLTGGIQFSMRARSGTGIDQLVGLEIRRLLKA